MDLLKDSKRIMRKKLLTEKELLLVKSRINCKRVDIDDIPFNDDGYKLTKEQKLKGYNWLMNLWKTPRGIERKNNPFGYRESFLFLLF